MNPSDYYFDADEPIEETLGCEDCGGTGLMDLNKIMVFLRKDDNAIFSLNEDKTTFSHHDHKVQFPLSIHHKYTAEYLLQLKFIPLVKMDEYD